jgi:hypothetical protein
MIYISVDNDHHAGLALALIKKLGLNVDQVIFISHISRRNNTVPASSFKREVIAGHPLSNGSSFKNPLSYWRALRHQLTLARRFEFSRSDVLLITTEYQLNNALLARKMKRAGGEVCLFDEGIGFYFNNSPFHDTHTSYGRRFFLFLYNQAFRLLGIPAYAKKGFEGRMYVRIKEAFIDRIYSRMRLPISRPVKICGYRNFLASERADAKKNSGMAIFFANNLSSFGLREEEMVLSRQAIGQMEKAFGQVYIKIHPADWIEKNEVYLFYKNLAESSDSIHLIDNAMTGNEAIEHFKPSTIVGMLGAVMFDALFFGCQPIFLFHLLPAIDEFDVCRYTLDDIGYQYIDDIAAISPNYSSGVNVSSILYEQSEIRLQRPVQDSRGPEVSFHA